MGLDIAMEQHSWSHVGFIFFSIVSTPLLDSLFLLFFFIDINFLWFLNSVNVHFSYLLVSQGIAADFFSLICQP